MIIVIGNIKTTPEGRARALALSLEHVARSRAEPGCIDHRVSIDCEDEMKLTFVEHWQDMAALKTHFGVKASQNFVKDLTACLSEPPEMTVYEAEAV